MGIPINIQVHQAMAAAGLLGGHVPEMGTWTVPTYADALAQGRRFCQAGTQTQLTDGQFDSSGNPTVAFRSWVLEGSGSGEPAGTYKLSFTGQANLTVGESGSSVSNKVYANGVTTADVYFPAASAGTVRYIDFDAAVSNVHLMYPGHTWGTDYFRKEVVSMSAVFSCIRFSAAQGGGGSESPYRPSGIMGSTDTAWSTRASPLRRGYAEQGLPWEDMVIFANLTGQDIWVCLPMNCTDDYMLKAVQAIRYGTDGTNPYTSYTHDPADWTPGSSWYPGLMSGRRVYLEFSNEIWNYNSSSSQAAAQAEVDAGNPHHFSTSDSYTQGIHWTAWKTVRMSLYARQVFGSVNGDNDVVKIVYANQGDQGGWDFHRRALQYIDTVWGAGSAYNTIDGITNPKQPVSYYVHNISGSFYIGCNKDGNGVPTATTVGTMGTLGVLASGSGMLAELKNSLSVPGGNQNLYENSVYERHQDASDLADEYGVKFSSYETGIEIFSYGSVGGAWTDASMYTIYYNLLVHPSTLPAYDIMIQSATVRGVRPPNELSKSYTAADGFPWPQSGSPSPTRMWLATIAAAEVL